MVNLTTGTRQSSTLNESISFRWLEFIIIRCMLGRVASCCKPREEISKISKRIPYISCKSVRFPEISLLEILVVFPRGKLLPKIMYGIFKTVVLCMNYVVRCCLALLMRHCISRVKSRTATKLLERGQPFFLKFQKLSVGTFQMLRFSEISLLHRVRPTGFVLCTQTNYCKQ